MTKKIYKKIKNVNIDKDNWTVVPLPPKNIIMITFLKLFLNPSLIKLKLCMKSYYYEYNIHKCSCSIFSGTQCTLSNWIFTSSILIHKNWFIFETILLFVWSSIDDSIRLEFAFQLGQNVQGPHKLLKSNKNLENAIKNIT